MAHLLSKFRIVKTPDTKLELRKGNQFLLDYDYVYVGLEKRKD